MEESVVNLSERALAREADRDAEAFTQLYERYLDPVTAFMRANTQDAATADDLASRVFFKALTCASTYRGEGSYRSWIFQIARNTLASWHADRARLQIPVEEVPEQPDATPSPALLTVVDEERDLLWDTVADLPEAQREVVHLRYRGNLSVDEIARKTRRSSVAVRQLLHRAKQGLRKRLRTRDVAALLGAATGTSALVAIGYRRHRRAR
jgi:RNA polymerase sigma-70 factor (ECF subfamily)